MKTRLKVPKTAVLTTKGKQGQKGVTLISRQQNWVNVPSVPIFPHISVPIFPSIPVFPPYFHISHISQSGSPARPSPSRPRELLRLAKESATIGCFLGNGRFRVGLTTKNKIHDRSNRMASPKEKRVRRRQKSKGTFASPIEAQYLRKLGITAGEYAAIGAFEKLKGQEKLKAARKIIADSIIEPIDKPDARCALAIAESESLLKGYATLDEPHRAEIAKLIEQITAYLRDATRKRPLNALMLAAPGAGKSHFIKQLAVKMRADRGQAVTFNMATMQSTDDMAQPVDELRNLKVNDRFPLLFLDEFDSDPSRYAALLPLLWEGSLHVGNRDLKLGKAVIVLAGSNPDLPKAMDLSAKMGLNPETQEEFVPAGKLIDLLSRINGGIINIPEFDLRTGERDRRVDKVCVTVALLRDRFGDQLTVIPRSLLRFIAQTTFRYGVRSIAHLIEVIDSDAFHGGALDGGKLVLPTNSEEALRESSLRLHLLDKDQSFGIVNRWLACAKDTATVDLGRRGFDPYLWTSLPFVRTVRVR